MQSENNQQDAPQALNAPGKLNQQTICVDLTATNNSANQSQVQKMQSSLKAGTAHISCV